MDSVDNITFSGTDFRVNESELYMHFYFSFSHSSLSPRSGKGVRSSTTGNHEDTVRARGKSTGSNVYVEIQ